MIPQVNFLRAVACLLVIIVHSTAYQVGYGNTNYFVYGLNQFTRLGTPIFAVISAFLLFNSVNNRGFNIKRFVTSRISKVVIPYIFWTIFYTFLLVLIGNEFSFNYKTLLSLFVFGEGYYHLYFMSLIIQFYFIFPLAQMLKNRWIILAMYFLTLPLNYFSLNWESGIGVIDDFIMHRSFFLKWCSYFMIGWVMAHYFDRILLFINRYTKLIYALFIIMLTSMFIETYFIERPLQTYSNPSNLLYIPIFILFLLLIYPSISSYKISNIFNLIGTYSLGIYLIHPLVIFLLELIIPEKLLLLPYFPVITFVLTVSICVVFIKTSMKVAFFKYILPIPIPIRKKNNDHIPMSHNKKLNY